MVDTVKLAVVGAGLVGLRHMAAIEAVPGVELAAIVEPRDLDEVRVPRYGSIEALLSSTPVDGVILATPNVLHVEGGMACVDHGVPVLIEKPLAVSSAEAEPLILAAEARNVPILVGHHRRHNPLIQKAAALIHGGALGTLRAAQATCWFYKPDDYFEIAPWRKQKGAGPISVNLVHDVDLMRYFMGEVVSVQAQMAPSLRGFDNEDLAAALLRFESGALCTITVSDSIAAPWSWELTAGEYPIYPTTGQSCYVVGGSEGSLSVPDLRLWRHEGGISWWNPISATSMPRAAADPLINQIAHFADVVRGQAAPLVSGAEGLRTLQVVEAIQQAALSGTTVTLRPDAGRPAQAAQ